MIKKTLITIFFCILLINIVSAEELTLLDTEYIAGETLQAYVTNTSISTSQISLLDNSSNLVSISPLISKYRDEQYLIYFNLASDLTEGNYKLIAKSMEANFTVSTSTSALQIKPGIIILDENEESFKLELTLVGDPITVQISSSSSDISPRRSALSFTTEETKNLYSDYTYSSIESDSTISLTYGTNSYSIPIIYTGEVPLVEETVNETIEETNITIEEEVIVEEIEEIIEALSFLTTKEKAEIPLESEGSYSGYLNFINNLEESIFNLEFSLTGNLEEIIELNVTTLEEIKGGETLSQYIWVNKEESNKTGEFIGELVLSNELYSTSLSIEVTIAEEETEEIIEEEEEIVAQEPIVINEEDLYFPEQDEGVSGTTVLGIIMIIILLGIFILIFIKMRQKEEKKFNQYIQETKRK